MLVASDRKRPPFPLFLRLLRRRQWRGMPDSRCIPKIGARSSVLFGPCANPSAACIPGNWERPSVRRGSLTRCYPLGRPDRRRNCDCVRTPTSFASTKRLVSQTMATAKPLISAKLHPEASVRNTHRTRNCRLTEIVAAGDAARCLAFVDPLARPALLTPTGGRL